MATRVLFQSESDPNYTIEVFTTEDGHFAIDIEANTGHFTPPFLLDRRSAIKLAKEIRKQISFIGEVEDGR